MNPVENLVTQRPASTRLFYLDTLRVIATLLLLVFHTGLVFTPFYDYVIVNPARSLAIGVFSTAFLHLWHMPLFFCIAGAGIHFSLQNRSAGQFALERLNRLFVPFLLGFFLLIPPQVYLGQRLRSIFQGPYPVFLRRYFTTGLTDGSLTWHHLWFILYLFALSMVGLPLLRYLSRSKGRLLLVRLGTWLGRNSRLFLLALPLVATELLFRARWPGYYNLIGDWANVTLFFLVLIYGYWLEADDSLSAATLRLWPAALIAAAALTIPLLVFVYRTGAPPYPGYHDWFYYPLTAVRAIVTWCWLIAWLGFGRQVLNRPVRWLRYASQMSYPVYIVHQTILVAIAYGLALRNSSIGFKYGVILVGTLLLSVLAAEVIKRIGVLRPIIGLNIR